MLEIGQHIHIVGIGGAGMSAIARVLKARGFVVHGSDRQEGRLIAALREEGIPVAVGHAPENLGDADLVLASSAIPENNPEIQAAHQQGVPIMRRPEFLSLLTAGYDVIAVAGAHGKTTVAGMITTILLAADLDPTYIVGGMVRNLSTNARVGKGPLFVIEADEYCNTFLALTPKIAVVTNIEYDHPDVFPSMRFLRLAFGEFIERIREDGTLIVCSNDAVASVIAGSFHARGGKLVLYGNEPGRELPWHADAIRTNEVGGIDFEVLRHGTLLGTVRLQIPGTHNVLNALAALAVADELGIAFETACAGLAEFSGTARRFEKLGEAGGVIVIDDYAHHPTQIKVVLEMAHQRYPGHRLIAVWQPHTFSRVKALREEFLTAFEGADRVLVLPVYAAREVEDSTINAPDLAASLVHPAASAAISLQDAADRLAEMVEVDDVVILMGAGDEYVVGEHLLTRLG
ncbi:MAG: UDP-N-acetylmuramate--L-alanine ligase [Anaerolineae bacterium]|jgi:UDP-N-acetylmuramate--alanine ligase|nr:UDP-N-acetylmuramate--L-alanine ligase [Anaerolineae bacterium]